MTMTKKDFEAVALCVKQERANWAETPEVQSALNYLVSNLTSYFAAQNERFDRERFAAAAGGGL